MGVFVCSSLTMLLLLSSLFFVIGRAHSGSTGCFSFLQYFNVDVTVETIFSSLVGSTWFQLAVFVWSSISDSMLLSSQFPVIVGPVSRPFVGPTRVQLVVLVCYIILLLMLLLNLFSVIGRANSGSTGSFHLRL